MPDTTKKKIAGQKTLEGMSRKSAMQMAAAIQAGNPLKQKALVGAIGGKRHADG
ncbi:MAG: hypothetical protein MRZ28_09800 [Oscillospiraceae bacterium]|nr:hypothetical protein [Oscillospiraceae bacterium]MCM0706582.1 hypothetical protein [Faecalicatena sp. BF-R-105]MDY3218778.1 hypothetical protein [Candidatus Fimivivens sp.]GKH50144.1 hypothetical protein CE91St46_12550 [Eubacteriales bacterium]GKH62780.1 hypothetical protein CE91St47_12490 [Eubacteriales bacterium]